MEMEMEVVKIRREPSWEERISSMGIGKRMAVDPSFASSARSAISRYKKYVNPNANFRTWSDVISGEEFVIIERMADTEEVPA